MQDVQGQQQSMNANMQNSRSPAAQPHPLPSNPAPRRPLNTRAYREKRQALRRRSSCCCTRAVRRRPGAPPADELYKTALGDYMAAKYALAASEFGDVVKNYPDNPLAGNAYYYQAEIDYRGGRYAAPSSPTTASSNNIRIATRFPSRIFTKAWRWSLSIRRMPACVSSALSSSASPTHPKPCRRAANSAAWASP